jgi:hypothetical protein
MVVKQDKESVDLDNDAEEAVDSDDEEEALLLQPVITSQHYERERE